MSEPIETNTVKQLTSIYDENTSDLQQKMKALRSKWLECDEDSSMTFRAIQIYDDYIRFNIRSIE